MEQQHLKDAWRFAGMRHGALYVMNLGQDMMHKWPADSLDTLLVVWKSNIILLIDNVIFLEMNENVVVSKQNHT